MLDSMKNEFGTVANTVNAGKWDWVWNWYETPGGSWVPPGDASEVRMFW